jgi:hypothetical protein
VRYVWLTLIGVSIVPVALVSVILNPLTFFALGAAAWGDQVTRLRPYRWWVGASLVVLAVATTVYAARYG